MHPYIMFSGNRIVAYDLFEFLGVLASFFFFKYFLDHTPFVDKKKALAALVIGFFLQYAGGTIIPYINRWYYHHQAPWLNFIAKSPGRYFHSVFLTMLCYWTLVPKIFRWPVRRVLDGFFMAVVLASAIGRIGCLMQGCCGGKPANLPWAMRIPPTALYPAHPTQIYMIILESILFIYLIYLDKKRKSDGQVFWTGFMLYSVYRFFIEFVRVNPPASLGLTHAQLFSVGSAILSLIMLKRVLKKTTHPPTPPKTKHGR